MPRRLSELGNALVLLALAVVLSAVVGHFSQIALLLLTALYVRQSMRIHALEAWLSRGAFGDRRQQRGIWGDIYNHIWKIRKIDKKRKKKLGRMIDRFRNSTDALPDAAVVLGPNGEIDWTNKAAWEVLGLKKSDKGHRINNLVRNPVFVDYLKANDYRYKISIPSPTNETIILQIGVVPYGDGLRLLMAQDITHMKNIERMRTDFVANVSHELRTPLTVLRGYLETLQEMEDMPAHYDRSFQSMTAQTERMQCLIEDLLLLARLETKIKKSECVLMPQLLKQICRGNDLLDTDQQRVSLTLVSDSNLQGDSDELRSAFTNLLINALKYSPPDKPVYVTWGDTANGGLYL